MHQQPGVVERDGAGSRGARDLPGPGRRGRSHEQLSPADLEALRGPGQRGRGSEADRQPQLAPVACGPGPAGQPHGGAAARRDLRQIEFTAANDLAIGGQLPGRAQPVKASEELPVRKLDRAFGRAARAIGDPDRRG